MKVAAITGVSGAGKTTLIVALIRRFVAMCMRVGAIKHTHHAINEERRGDTGAFLDAGTDPAVIAARGEAVGWGRSGIMRVSLDVERKLLEQFGVTEIVMVEGFKASAAWPKVDLGSERMGIE